MPTGTVIVICAYVLSKKYSFFNSEEILSFIELQQDFNLFAFSLSNAEGGGKLCAFQRGGRHLTYGLIFLEAGLLGYLSVLGRQFTKHVLAVPSH